MRRGVRKMAKRRKKKARLIGSSDVLAALEDLAEGLRGDAIRDALLDGGQIVQLAAQARVPRQSLELYDSIVVSDGNDGQLAVPKPRSANETLVAVGSNSPHAHRIEHGFFGVDALGRAFEQKAKPFLRPALDRNRNAVVEAVEKSLREQLNLDGG